MHDETYLGDGLYASFDGECIKLRAPREHGDNDEVFLDEDTFLGLLRFMRRWGDDDKDRNWMRRGVESITSKKENR